MWVHRVVVLPLSHCVIALLLCCCGRRGCGHFVVVAIAVVAALLSLQSRLRPYRHILFIVATLLWSRLWSQWCGRCHGHSGACLVVIMIAATVGEALPATNASTFPAEGAASLKLAGVTEGVTTAEPEAR
jgi:hypothetical protein